MENNRGILSGAANIGIATAILNISYQNFEMNKGSLKINRKMLENTDNSILFSYLDKICKNQEIIIELLRDKE